MFSMYNEIYEKNLWPCSDICFVAKYGRNELRLEMNEYQSQSVR